MGHLTGGRRTVSAVASGAAALLLVQLAGAATGPAAATTRHPRYSAATVPAPQASWITNPHWVDPPTSPSSSSAATPLPVFVKQVTLPSAPVSAVLSIAGEGVTVATVNGKPVSAAVLEPGYSADTVRVDFTGYDVTSLLGAGDNRIAVQLGTGIYAEAGAPDRYLKLPHVSGPIGFIAELTVAFADGTTTTIDSDTSWSTTLGDTTYAGWYGGEDADLRRLPADWELPSTQVASWDSAVLLTSDVPTKLQLTRRIGPPVQVVGTSSPVSLVQVSPTRWMADFGSNLAGWPQVSVDAAPGTRLVLTPGEVLGSDGSAVDQRTMGVSTSPVYDSVVLTGSGTEQWHPQFVYHGFRYLQVDVTDGSLRSPLTMDSLARLQLRTAVARSGDFSTSDPMLSSIHDLVDRAMQSNMFSVLTDCPNREKLGWLEQDGVVFDSLADSYDMSTYGRRFVQHMADSQRADGGIPDIAPENVTLPAAYREDPNWGGSFVTVPWRLFQNYDDVDTMTSYYPQMTKYVDHLNGEAAATGGVLSSGLGDWLTLDPRTPRALVVGLGYERVLTTMTSVAHALGRSADEAHYAAIAAIVARRINDRWLRSTGDYGPDQASNALALDAGIVPPWAVASTRSALLRSLLAAGGHLRVGEIGLPAVLHQLSAAGRDDLAYRAVVASDAIGGFGYIVASGATALTEEWGGQTSTASQNHLVLGTVDDWMTTRIAGLRQAPGAVGFSSLVVSPSFVPGLASAAASRTVATGTISVSWTRNGDQASVQVTLPRGVTAQVQLPSGSTAVGEGQHTITTAVGGWPTSLPAASPWRGAGPVLATLSGLYRTDLVTHRPLHLTPEEYSALGRPAYTWIPSYVVRLPWSPVRWLVTRWTPTPSTWTATALDDAAWRDLRSPPTRVAALPGLQIGAAAPSADVWARTPDGLAHRLTYTEFVALGRPRREALVVRWARYPGSPDIWAVQTWLGGRTSAHRVGLTEWRLFGSPRPASVPLAPGSAVLRWGASPQLFLRTPDGRTRALSAADYAAIGRPRVTYLPGMAFVRVPGSAKILLLTDTTSGAGLLLTLAAWTAYGRPVPEWRTVPHLRWTTGADGIAIELTGGTRIPMTTAEWQAAGQPALVPV